ncbi:MAG: LegC family aminotransferase [Elusimicrobiota bacterium]|nr:LegC family aminotransferase [Elusimicrobiota bacterium]
MAKLPLIPLSAPAVGGNAWRYVKDCLDTGWVSSVGRYVSDFERSTAAFTGSKHAVACVNGTAGLHASLTMSGIGRGDAVLVPALTFIATANAVAYTGAACLFVDCEPRRFNMDFARLEEYLEKSCVRRRGGALIHKSTGLRVKALMPAHILGYPADLDAAQRLCRRFGLILIEDAAESVGSTWRGRHTGLYGRFGVLSFNGNKLITTGGGGMILAQSASLARRAKHLTTQAKSHPTEYAHDAVGWNYRLTNVLAALGVSQMELLPSYLEKRRKIAGWYRATLPGVPVAAEDPRAVWNRWLFAAEVPGAKDKARLLAAMDAAACQARPLWQPIPTQKPYRGHPSMPIPAALAAYARTINIPSTTTMTRADAARVAAVLRRAPLTRLLA